MAEIHYKQHSRPYSASIALAQANIEKYPELMLYEGQVAPTLFAISSQQMRMLFFEADPTKDLKTNVEHLSIMLQKLTETQFMALSCEGIQHLISENHIGFVYYGTPESMEIGGDMHHLHLLSSLDRFSFADQLILFFYNTDPKCREKRGLPADKPSVVLYVNNDYKPFVMSGESEDLSIETLYNFIQISVTQGSLNWKRRAVYVMQ